MFKKSIVRFGKITEIQGHINGPAQIFYMDDAATEPGSGYWGRLGKGVTAWRVPCKVLRPTGPDGSFSAMDDQAVAIGKFIAENLRMGVPVFICCDHAEIRSPAVAMGLSEIAEGRVVGVNGEEIPPLGTFGGRTAGIIASTLDDILDRLQEIKEVEAQIGIEMPSVIVVDGVTVTELSETIARIKDEGLPFEESEIGGYLIYCPKGRIQLSAVYGTERMVTLYIQAHRRHPVHVVSEILTKILPKGKYSSNNILTGK